MTSNVWSECSNVQRGKQNGKNGSRDLLLNDGNDLRLCEMLNLIELHILRRKIKRATFEGF